MNLTYYTSGGSGDAGDQYTGLDRFGRVVDQRWENGGVDLERLKYGYDQASNQVWRQNTVAATGQDQYYTDDGLYQLKTLQRGTLNATQTGISGTPSWEEDWNYDPLGNWNGSKSAYQTKVAGTTTLNQNRTHNPVNEITGLTTSTGTAWTTPAHDAAGNMTSAPQPLSPGKGCTLTYDAWNRLVEVKAGSTVVVDYAYDGASRRVTKTGTDMRHYYYDDQWRVVKERLNTITTADRRFVWGIRRLDDLILRDQASAIRLYAMDDKINVTAVVDTSGAVQERYGYNGFGGVRYMDAGFNPIPASTLDWETLFDSYRYDTESGLYQVRHRYLHPLLGRWITRDPIEEKGGINLYGFVFNDPIDRYDLLGLDCPGCDYLTAASPLIEAAIILVYGTDNGFLFSSPCALRACAQHDQCYFLNKCSMSSWGSTLLKLSLANHGIPVSYSPCDQCNLNVVGYMAECVFSEGNYHSDDPQYFCVKLQRFITIPGDFPTLDAAKCACCTN